MIHLMKYLGEYKKRAVMTPIWVILETICELFLTVTIGRFIDELSNSETTMSLIYEYGLRLIIIAALCFVFGTICGWESVKAASGLSKNLRNAMFDRIQDFSFTNIDRFSTNSLVTRMTTDVANVQNAFMMMLRVAAKAPVSIVCALVMAFMINWKIGLVYIIVIPILLVGLLIIARAIVGVSGGISMTTGDLQNLITYAMMILMSLMMLSMIYVMTMISRECVSRIREVLAEKPTIGAPEDAVKTIENGGIDFEHVGFSYADDPGKLCLSDIDLHIKSGETIGIIGGTGSGKSSLVQLIPRLYDATVGSVKVAGRDVREYDIEALRDAVAVVLQKNVLFAGTIKENLRWGKPDATDEEIAEVCRLAQADGFISRFPDGYDSHIEQGGTNVSGGQKQRLCIARALLKRPKVLILDDSTSAVDTRTDALIRKAFREYIPETTKIIIAQRISSVQDADRIIVMDGGRIDAVGTHEELLKSNKIYQEVYDSQQKGGGDDE